MEHPSMNDLKDFSVEDTALREVNNHYRKFENHVVSSDGINRT